MPTNIIEINDAVWHCSPSSCDEAERPEMPQSDSLRCPRKLRRHAGQLHLAYALNAQRKKMLPQVACSSASFLITLGKNVSIMKKSLQ